MGWLLRRSDPEDSRSRRRRSPDRRARGFKPHAEAMEGRMLLSAIPPPPPGGGAWFFQGGGIILGHKIQGAIYAKWVSLGGFRSSLGLPLTDEMNDGFGGRISHFQGGVIDLSPQTGAHEVHGAILAKWNDLRAHGINLGHPTSDEMNAPSDLRLGPGGRISQGGFLLT